MLETLGDHPQRQGLNSCYRLVAVGAVAHHSRQCRDLGEPAAVSLRFELDGERHEANVPSNRSPNKRLQPTAAGAIMSRPG